MHSRIGHNKPPRRDTAEIRKAILFNRAMSAKTYPRDPNGYRVDRLYSNYMGLQPRWQRKVANYLRELKSRGERVVYADICGRSTAIEWGVDISYCFALHTDNFRRRLHPSQDVIIDGDIFCMRDFNSFLSRMRDSGDRPAFVTFYPMAGLQSYTPWDSEKSRETLLHPQVTWQRIANNLRRLIETMRPGGYVYLDRPFQLYDHDLGAWFRRAELENYPSVQWMKAFCKGKRCSLEFDRDITGVKFLLRKYSERKTTSKPPSST